MWFYTAPGHVHNIIKYCDAAGGNARGSNKCEYYFLNQEQGHRLPSEQLHSVLQFHTSVELCVAES